MGKKTREIITETDSEGREKTKTIEKEIIDTEEEQAAANPYEFMTNAELLAEWERIGGILKKELLITQK